MRVTGLALLALGLSLLSGCSKKPDTLIETADGVSISPAEIDRDPLALLPGDAIGVARIDTPAFFQSQFGQRLRALTEARMPLPPSAGFDPARDLEKLYLGFYSMQGADFAIVAKGTFKPDAIEKAADGTTNTPLGAPLVKSTYAKRTLYTSRNIGFVVLTDKTVLMGNETGIRRALDRMDQGRMKRDLPTWMDEVLATPNVPMAAAFDFAGQPVAEATSRQLPFLRGIQTARTMGNFEPPGVNVGGSMTYATPEEAVAGAQSLLGLHQQIKTYGFLMALAGIKDPIARLEALPNGKDVTFAVALEANAVEWLLGRLADQLGAPGQTVPATLSPPASR